MKHVELARMKNFVLVGKKGRTMTKFVGGKVYSVTDGQATKLLSLSTDRDIPVFKMSKVGQGGERPVEKPIRSRAVRGSKVEEESQSPIITVVGGDNEDSDDDGRVEV